MSETSHDGMWECIENENHKRATYRRTPDSFDDVTHIEVRECRDCGTTWVAETLWGEMGGDIYEVADVDAALAAFGLLEDAR